MGVRSSSTKGRGNWTRTYYFQFYPKFPNRLTFINREKAENVSVDDFLERIDRYLGVFFTLIYLGSVTILYILI